MGNAITSEKIKHAAPELIVRPKVGRFRTLDFLQATQKIETGGTQVMDATAQRYF